MHLGKASKELRTIDGHFGNYHISFWVIYGPQLDFFVKQDHESDLVIIYRIENSIIYIVYGIIWTLFLSYPVSSNLNVILYTMCDVYSRLHP
jgi:hypothetical protein